MTNEERDIQRKLRVLQHAEKIGNARKACRYFGIGRSSFYRWRDAYQKSGESGLKNAKSIPRNPANQTPPEIGRTSGRTWCGGYQAWPVSGGLIDDFVEPAG